MSATAIGLVGTGVSAISSYQAGVDQQQGYYTQAAAKRAQAAEVEIGTNRQLALLRRQSEMVGGAQLSAYGHSGVEGSKGSPLAQMEQTRANIAEQMMATQQYGDYHKQSILTEGYMDEIYGDQAYRSGVLNMFGTGFKGVAGNPYMMDPRRRANQAQGGNYTGADSGADFGGIA